MTKDKKIMQNSVTEDGVVVLKNSRHRCYYCDAKLVGASLPGVEGLQRTREHIVPKAAGGNDLSINIVWACGPCNNRRGSLSLDRYIIKCRDTRELEQVRRLITYTEQMGDKLRVPKKKPIKISQQPFHGNEKILKRVSEWQGDMSCDDFILRLSKKFPAAYARLDEAMWVWIFDNLIKKSI